MDHALYICIYRTYISDIHIHIYFTVSTSTILSIRTMLMHTKCAEARFYLFRVLPRFLFFDTPSAQKLSFAILGILFSFCPAVLLLGRPKRIFVPSMLASSSARVTMVRSLRPVDVAQVPKDNATQT